MTSLALRQIVERALAEVGADPRWLSPPRGRPRTTTWLGVEQGFGIRHYSSGRQVYIVQARMGGRVRTITLGPASVLTRHQATTVARLILAWVRIGRDPATDRQRVRAVPRFDDFLEEYWACCSLGWKPSTLRTHEDYRRNYLNDAFPANMSTR